MDDLQNSSIGIPDDSNDLQQQTTEQSVKKQKVVTIIQINPNDSSSINFDSDNKFLNSNLIEDQNNQSENAKFLLEQGPFFVKYKYSLISSSITLLIIIINIILFFTDKSKEKMHIVPKTLEIINEIGSYIIWSIHCIGLVLLPFLFVNLFAEKTKLIQLNTFIFLLPIMMLLNLIGGAISIKWSWIPLILELLLTIFLLFYLPFDSIYVPKKKNFWIGEIALMLLAFIYISSSLGASNLSYIMYGSYIHVNNFFSTNPSNPHYAIEYLKYIKSHPKRKVLGEFLSCYSFFTFCSVGIGFVMSLKNSILMIIPFLILSICTIIETKPIGTLLFCQLLIHLIYIIFLHFKKTRFIVKGSFIDCLKDFDHITLLILIIGDIVMFFLVVFPMLHLVIYKDGNIKFRWGYFIAGSFVMFLAIICNIIVQQFSEICLFLAPTCFFGASCIYGFFFAGYVPFIRLFIFEITCLSWSIYLFFWCFSQGFSPILINLYHFLIPIASCAITELYEGIGWIEILCAVIQIPLNTFIIHIVKDKHNYYLEWVMCAATGMILLAGIFAVPLIIGMVLLIICCQNTDYSKAGESISNMADELHETNKNLPNNTYIPPPPYYVKQQAVDYATRNDLATGTTFTYDGYTFKVS